jgi:hypothetical protein
MMMREEHSAKLRDWQSCHRKLPRDAVAAIHEVHAIADNDRLRGSGTRRLRRRASRSSEQHQACADLLSADTCAGCH